MRSLGDRLPGSVRGLLAPRVGIDPRALAALRVSLGVLILADLAIRATDLTAFYTDSGVLPRSVLSARFPAFADLSLHAVSGAGWVQTVLFLVAALFGIALIFGYRTRVVALVSLVLLVSLHLRNPILLNAGDSLLRRLLFWGLFLPLGARWSVDSLGGQRRTDRVASPATVAILLQVVIVYSVNAVLKLRSPLWRQGRAIRHVFELDQLTIGLGDLLAELSFFLEVLGYLWLILIVAAPLLVILTGWRRSALAGLFAVMHLGMAVTMRLGLFPFVSIAALLPFFHPAVWDRIEARLAPITTDSGIDRWGRRLRGFGPPSPRIPVRFRASIHGTAQSLVAILVVLVLVWNAASLGAVTLPEDTTGAVNPVQYRWDMFAPNPRGNDGWYVVPGRLASGRRVDAFHRGPPTWDRPPDLARTFPSHRWFVYLLDLLAPRNRALREPFAAYLCRRWNAGAADRLVNLSVYYVEESVRLDGPDPRRRILLATHTC